MTKTGYKYKSLSNFFPKSIQGQFSNIVTVDETWSHYLEPVRTIGNKNWLTKHGKSHIVSKRTIRCSTNFF